MNEPHKEHWDFSVLIMLFICLYFVELKIKVLINEKG
jgi:hypothetical protein